MKIGYVGLGKMGSNMVKRLLEKEYEVVVYDKDKTKVEALDKKGAEGSDSLEDMVSKLSPSRLVWVMVPHNFSSEVIRNLAEFLQKGDVIVDGGNSFYKDTVENARFLEDRGVHMLDAGVSGGPSGARNGASMMIGGDKKVYEKYEELFNDLTVSDGYGRVGRSGAGHFVKMVHNGIEYGMMQAIAEGFDVMNSSEFDLPLEKIARIYNNGAVVSSNLMKHMKSAFDDFGKELDGVSGKAGESGEGRWTVEKAHEEGVFDRVIHSALNAREASRMSPNFQGKVINALRNKFGGHSSEDPEVNL
ncbi:MAG: phosphogluconate dehydrogenase (NAD(+)-dependent, decarboxylating) [Candidatus Magasanikbacteria bacterium]